MSTFDDAFSLVVGVEGGFTADPKDHGNYTANRELKGTKYGISAASYPDLDIANLTLDAAKAIYQRDYWAKIGGDDLPVAAAIVLFDYAVNSGVGGKIAVLQQCAGVPADGVFGPVSKAAVAAMGGPKLAVAITAQRITALAGLSAWKDYGRGWAMRMAAILAAAIEHETIKPAVTTYISPMPPVDQLKQALRDVLSEGKAA